VRYGRLGFIRQPGARCVKPPFELPAVVLGTGCPAPGQIQLLFEVADLSVEVVERFL
jgi:hypothetical protein